MKSKRLKVFLIGGLTLVVVLGIGLFLWARAVLAGDGVRTAVESQLSQALGQPVTIGRLGVSILPRVTMDLSDVTIGKPARITIRTLHVGTALGALLSRRIENAAIRLSGARIELPLPPLRATAPSIKSAAPPTTTRPPVELVSIDEITLADVEVVSGGRSLRADVAVVPHDAGFTIRRLELSAGPTRVSVTGEIKSLAGPTGDLTLTARGLNVLELAAFVTDFSAGAGLGSGGSAPAGGAMNLAVAIDADRATFGTLNVERLKGRARITSAAVRIEPIAFGVFDGTYDGSVTLTPGRTPTIRLAAKIAKIDVASAMAFAGTPGQITGRAAGTLDVTGRGSAIDQLLNSVRGSAHIELTDGTIAGLGLVRTVVLAGSMREASQRQITGLGSTEPFTSLTAKFDVAAGEARTDDLRFESKNLLLAAAGGLRLDGRSVDFAGPVQLSDELSKQAGQDLLRYTAKDGRVTIPVTVTGPVDRLAVRVGMTDLVKRAITNRASEELKKGILKGLGKIIKD